MDSVTIEIKDKTGKVLYTEVAPARTFASGKKGYGAYGKVNLGTDRLQLSFNLVKIVPKP